MYVYKKSMSYVLTFKSVPKKSSFEDNLKYKLFKLV